MQRTASAPGAARGALLGACVVAGWLLHDLAVFATSGRPQLVQELAAGSLASALLGALVGAALGAAPLLVPALAAAGLLASLAPLAFDLPISRALIWLPRASLLLLLAWGGALLARRYLGLGLARGATCAGALACFVKTFYRHGLLEASWPVLAGVALALATARARPLARRAGAVLSLAAPAVWLAAWIAPDLSPSRPDLPPSTAAPPRDAPNVLLVVLDTVRADHLAPYGYERVTTPALDARVREHFTRYTRARSTSSWTLPVHASLFTGLLPAEHGSGHPGRWARPLREDLTTLAQRLRAAGRDTGAIPANQAYLRPEFGLDRGFRRFDDRKGGHVGGYLALAQLGGRRLHVGHHVYREAPVITDLALEWIDRDASEPFFLFLNYMDAHRPLIPPDAYAREFGDGGPADPLALDLRWFPLLYDRELRYLDDHLDRLFDGLQRRGLWEETAIVVTSDHGEGLGDHGLAYHGRHVFDSLVHVPLYVKPAGGRARESDDSVLSSADVHDLLLALAGLAPRSPPDPTAIQSEYYAGNPDDPEMLALEERTGLDLDQDFLVWLRGNRKVVVSSKGEVVAYDLAEDPGELRPLELSGAEVEEARRRAGEWWSEHPPERVPRQEERDEETRAELRALGYGS